MHPYREDPASSPGTEESTPGEEWVLAVLLAVLGGVRVTIALAAGEDIRVDVTVAAILGVIGFTLLAQLAARSFRRP